MLMSKKPWWAARSRNYAMSWPIASVDEALASGSPNGCREIEIRRTRIHTVIVLRRYCRTSLPIFRVWLPLTWSSCRRAGPIARDRLAACCSRGSGTRCWCRSKRTASQGVSRIGGDVGRESRARSD